MAKIELMRFSGGNQFKHDCSGWDDVKAVLRQFCAVQNLEAAVKELKLYSWTTQKGSLFTV